MIDFLKNLFVLYIDMGYYMVIGLTLVGILHVYVNKKWVSKHLGNHSFGSVIKASLFGVPLPLCSCGVVPTAVYFKKNGASTGAVVSFLISTPQTGVDSIIATYGLMGPVLAIFRPFAAFISGIVGGGIVNLFARNKDQVVLTSRVPDGLTKSAEEGFIKNSAAPLDSPIDASLDNTPEIDCGCSNHGCEQGCEDDISEMKNDSFSTKLRKMFSYAFGEFLDDIVIHFIVGLIVAALITTLIPDQFFSDLGVNSGIIAMLIMIVIGLPMYICSTSSIPIAIALILKGFSPGAAFVFLFVGPVTNAASLALIGKALGKKITIIYIVTVSALSIAFGYLLDFLLNTFDLSLDLSHYLEGPEAYGLHMYVVSGIFFLIILYTLFKRLYKKDAHAGHNHK
ncbi:MAG: SO_0444 family Cu/Zn efflux transporter [Vallitaleaceae bacterium]|jgi:uncharacterized membrane protein YraQ (UPF0718 family)|nr:SO_0444 family Cu/Zn efflux transporter [Vallitaleaceae bacterium]